MAPATSALPTPGQGCLYGGSRDVSTTRAQQNFVIRIPSAAAAEEETLIWTGDRWQQAPDGIKGHEGQFWVSLSFDGAGRISHRASGAVQGWLLNQWAMDEFAGHLRVAFTRTRQRGGGGWWGGGGTTDNGIAVLAASTLDEVG